MIGIRGSIAFAGDSASPSFYCDCILRFLFTTNVIYSDIEQRYDVIGSSSAGIAFAENEEILFVVYTERDTITQEGSEIEVTRLISVRLANSFERGVYYANRR